MATYGFFNGSTPERKCDYCGAARRAFVEELTAATTGACRAGTGGHRRRPEPASMRFDDAARDGQRQADTSAFLIERSPGGIVCGLYARFFGDDHNGRARR